ncbi:ABC transporter ATP-binding protein [Tenuibacillus multivorans]|uniref:ATP-binding cassette, subfamily B n=1 Tax=Tenuibacillus multivorans TaxID=237069 RepID=A0A1H0EVX1_9BACI|nr:ABC transporter ATP-binding protein [Tenuibacillus multivorans]GEL76936.1 multidrug ABC transporter permease [Tenuibacillus multivorans]SDN86518.1 ATP-binding cassette, subfamily B [Tenuibacillus multivorans]
MKKRSTEKRLFRYAWHFKRTIIIGIICLMFAVALELTGPFIAKNLIDQHIVGVANHYVVSENSDGVYFNGETYQRIDRTNSDSDQIVTLYQDGLSFYLFNEQVPLNATLVSEGENSFVLESQDETLTVEGSQISTSEVFVFFEGEIGSIIRLLALYIGLILIASFFSYYKTYLLQFASNRIIQKMRRDVFGHIQRLPIKYFVDQPAGKIVARVTNDTEAIRELYVKVLEVFASGIVYMIGIFIALFILDAKLATICLVLLPLLVVWMKVYKKVGGKYNRTIRETNSNINANINESIQGMSIIQAYGQTERMTKEFETLNEKHYAYQIKMNTFTALTSFNLVDVLRNVGFVVFLMYFGGAALNGSSIVTAGLLYAFVDLLTRLFEPIEQIISQLAQLEQSRVAGGRVFELMDEEVEDRDHTPLQRYHGHVMFDDVSFAYEKDGYVLNHISFDVKPGETAAFVGHTGSGKSTIMNLLFRFYDPTHGRILIDGKDTKGLAKQQVRQHIGIVLQDPFIFTGTIISNITMNDPSISRDKAVEALKAVGADRFIEKLSNQYDEPVKEKGNEFSTGQRQLLSFARALAFDPAILILDEATANIDTETEGYIQEALQVLKKGRTTLVIAHRLSTIKQADQIFVLKHGKMIENGTHESLLKDRGEYFKMYEMQLGRKQVNVS